jgi:hypothetical protein
MAARALTKAGLLVEARLVVEAILFRVTYLVTSRAGLK